MNVTEANKVSDIITYLRTNIYVSNVFINEFSNSIKNTIYSMDSTFNPDPYGGWIVSVIVNRNKCQENNISHDSFAYIQKIKESLIYAINYINYNDPSIGILQHESIAPNIFNVILTGPDSISIKL